MILIHCIPSACVANIYIYQIRHNSKDMDHRSKVHTANTWKNLNTRDSLKYCSTTALYWTPHLLLYVLIMVIAKMTIEVM